LSISLSFPFFDFLFSGDLFVVVDEEAIGCGIGRKELVECRGDEVGVGVVRERDIGEVLSANGAWRCP
jgi:hypothetical protein